MTRAELDAFEHDGVITSLEATYLWCHDTKRLSYRQIALMYGVAHQTVHERCRRAHAKIQAYERAA